MSVMGDRNLDRKGKARSGQGSRAQSDGGWRGYINVSLTAAEKEQFEDWARTDEPWGVLEACVTSGCVCTVKRDVAGSGFLASVTQRQEGHVNVGLCVTARAGVSGKALFRVLFLVHLLGVDDSWEEHHPVADPDRW